MHNRSDNPQTTTQADVAGASSLTNAHRRVGLICGAVAVAMVGMSYAAVPLYQMFCQVTGYGGTTQVATGPSETVLDRKITMRFDANIRSSLDWTFEPVDRMMDVKLGETRLATYRATNNSSRTLTGTASFNVTPDSAGVHFNKIECFCFTEQTLKPGESVEMPVSFFVSPDLINDPDAKNITHVTLSYTFYPLASAEKRANRDDDAVRKAPDSRDG